MSGHCRITPDGSPTGLGLEPAGALSPVLGRIETLVGSCTVSRSGGPAVAIKLGDLVGPSDVVETSAGGRLSIRFTDGTTFTLSDKARMALKDYVSDETSAFADIDRGTFSFIAGRMAEAGRFSIQTPFASIRARRNGGGIGMLSLISLFFAAFEEAHAAPSDVAFLDDGNITSKDLGQFGIVELLVKKTATTPEFYKFLDDPGETIVIRASGSSVSVDSVTNSIAQMAQYQAAQQEALHTFSVGLQQGQGPTGNGAGGSSSPPPPEFIPPPQNINFVPDNNPPPNFTPPPGPPGFPQNNNSDPPPQGPPPPPPPPPAPGLVVERAHDTGDPTPDVTTGTLSGPGVSAGTPTFVWSNGALTPGDQSNLAAASSLTFTGSGPNDFTFHIPDQAVDFLAAGETLTVTYNVTIAGGGTEQAIITVFGTEDAPKLAADVSGSHTTAELPNDKNDPTPDHTAPGTLTFTDVDLNDTHSASSSLVSATWSGGATLPSGLSTVLASALSLTLHDSTSSQTGAGSIDFTFSAADKNFDFLAEGETLTVTYNVTVMDNFGATSTQAVTITINGSEDAPVITPAVQSGAVTEDTDGAPLENAETHHQSGTINFTDVDLTDHETSSSTLKQLSAVLANGYGLTPAQNDALVNAFTVDAATHSNVTGDGSIVWHYDIADSNLDFLGAHDVVTLTFTVQVADGHGGFASQDVTITVQGTEDKPVVTSGAQSGLVTEDVDGAAGENTETHHQSGAVTFTDVDLSDLETSSIANTQVSKTLANGYALTSAQQDALVNAFTIGTASHSTTDGTGAIAWHYDLADSAIDFLGANDVVTLTYTVQVNDGNGGIKTQDVVITVHGTEDKPVITSGAQSGLVTEDADGAPLENAETHHQSGAVTFTDVDLSDHETSSIANTQVSATLAHGYALTSAQQDALVNAFTIDPASHSTTDGTGAIAWHYDLDDSAIDFLGANDKVVLTFTVQVDDGNGGIKTQDVVVTVQGTEDKPVITSGAQSGLVTEDVDGAAGENTETHHQSGAVTFTDVDLSDLEASSIANTQVSATLAHGYALTSAQHDALVNAFTIGAATHSTTDGTGAIAWHYDLADSAIDFLGAHDVVTLTYTVQVDDGNGGIKTQDVVVTVQGTEDKPVITSGAQSGLVTEDADGAVGENTETHHQSGAVTFTDVDLSDLETSSIANTQLSATLANGYALTSAQHDALVNAFTIGAATHSTTDGTGSIAWHYDLADSAIDFLGAHDVVTLTYTVQVDDGNGGIKNQDVTVTVHGTEDKPVISASSNAFSELPGTNNPDTDAVSGAIGFSDVDLSDRPTVTAPFSSYSYLAADGITTLTLSAAQQSALELALTIMPGPTNAATGSASWTYSVADSALDFLAQGEKLTLTYMATVDDHNGGVVTKPITVTITGTEDAPALSASSNAFTELAGTNNPDTDSVSGAIGFNDVDLTDRPTVTAPFSSYSYIAANGTTALTLTAAQQSAVETALSGVPFTGTAANGSTTWTYSVPDKALDFLAQGETLTLTYTATVDDHHGSVVARPITVTIHGTNDAPVLSLDHHYNVQDQFNSQAYNLNTGGVAWATSWIETNEPASNPATTGDIQITGNHLTFSGNGDSIQRGVNLTGATAAILTFDYMRSNLDQFDSLQVQVSSDGGAHFTTVNQILGPGNDGAFQNLSVDISSFISANTVVKFVENDLSSSAGETEIVNIDNVNISYTGNGPAYFENGTGVAVVGTANAISDVDNTTMQSATITLANHQADDLLSINGALPSGITASSYNSSTGVLTLTGSASLASYDAALHQVIFSNSSDNPSGLDRSVTMTVSDGIDNSNSVTTTVHVVPIDDAPTATADNVITNFGNGNQFQIPDSALIANDTDPDNTLAQLSVTNVSNQNSGTAGHIAGAATFTDSGGTSGGSFDYTLSDGTLTSTGHVTVTDVSGSTLNGTAGNDIFIAKAGGSTMNGNGGNDVFIGNTGADIMNGGGGSDTFVFKATTDSPSAAVHDTINNFTHGSDHLDFSAIAGATQVQQSPVGAAGLVDAHSISWFVDSANNQTIVYVNTTGVANTVSMEVHLAGANVNLAGADILHHT